jgi:hypothetical protein
MKGPQSLSMPFQSQVSNTHISFPTNCNKNKEFSFPLWFISQGLAMLSHRAQTEKNIQQPLPTLFLGKYIE